MKIIMIMLVILLSGCATKTVYVPISGKCSYPTLSPEPDYPKISANNTDPATFVKWCVVSNKMCRDREEQLKTIMESVH